MKFLKEISGQINDEFIQKFLEELQERMCIGILAEISEISARIYREISSGICGEGKEEFLQAFLRGFLQEFIQEFLQEILKEYPLAFLQKFFLLFSAVTFHKIYLQTSIGISLKMPAKFPSGIPHVILKRFSQ